MRNTTALAAIFAITIASASVTGCASHRETTTVETTTSRDDGYNDRASIDFDDTETTTTRTETVAEERDDPDRGLFGIIGNIIALPFRAVGGLFQAIF